MKTRATARLVAGAMALVLGGCVTRVETQPPAVAGVGPSMVVEQFLAAANGNDLDTMARIFGTAEGPFSERVPLDERDKRLFVLASVLRHDDYELAGTGIVPGRRDRATVINVRMRFGQRQAIVPFIAVQTEKWGWLVEQVDLQKITYPPPGR